MEAGKAKEELALKGDDWADYWEERWHWERVKPLYDSVWTEGPNPKFHPWPEDELESRKLKGQDAARVELAWSELLAGKSKAFHEESERIAAGGKWKDKAFIAYSKTSSQKTTRCVVFHLAKETSYSNYSEVIPPYTTLQFIDGKVRLPKPTADLDDSLNFEQLLVRDGKYIRRIWNVAVTRTEGDGTVPLRSLLGFGGDASVFKPLPGNPEHVPAPNSPWLWDRILEALQGRSEDSAWRDEHLLKSADTKEGLES